MIKCDRDLHTLIKNALKTASSHLINDTEVLQRLIMPKERIESEIQDIVTQLDEEVSQICPTPKSKIAYSNEIKSSFQTTANLDRYDIFIIVPIFNASDQQTVACINSIIKSFANYNFCLVLYTNRSWEKMEGILAKNIPVIEFICPSFSLPFAYNSCIDYLRKKFNVAEELIIFMDDDAAIFDGQSEQIEKNIQCLQLQEALAISGHYFDDREPQNLFQKAINHTNCFSFAERSVKPYCHGGAVLMMKAKTYPPNGLPLEGLGGISLSILLINNIDENSLIKSDWFLRNTPKLQVFHPRKQNLIQWTATYLSYEIAWKRALSWLDAPKKAMWEKRLKETSGFRTQLLLYDINENGKESKHALANLLLTKYYKPILTRYFLYNDFVALDIQTHANLRETYGES